MEENKRTARVNAERQVLPEGYRDWLDTAEAAERLGFTKMHTKNLFRAGKVNARRFKFSTGYVKWFAEPASVDAYVPQSSGFKGMSRFILRVNPSHANIEDIKDWLQERYGDASEATYTIGKQKSSKKSGKSKARHEPAELVASILGDTPPHLKAQE